MRPVAHILAYGSAVFVNQEQSLHLLLPASIASETKDKALHKATAARWVRDGAGFVNSSYVKDRGVRKCEFGGDIVVELDISTRVAFLLDQHGAIPNLNRSRRRM